MPYDKKHKAKSRHKIIESATHLFSRYGFEKISIGQVMKQASLTHGAFYAHFESKEALYAECFSELLDDSRCARLVKRPLSVNKLKELVSNYWGLHQSTSFRTGPETVLFNEMGTDNERIKLLFQRSYENVRMMLEKRIIALSRIRKLGLSQEKVSDKARAIMASLVGAVTIAKMINDEEEQKKLLKTAQSQILSMLN
ncbi:TetR/AcrR family transcriptional regulator [Vibrio nitrifigilis]|uniref:TetR/AcrR family transcriptional regulator n=1 Tax=Vibrio nitrifigilis TaxID=2789781 RepID=A0ABS0GLU4_9VIBR|nr:TetR/AcrR family transcriptional regulator [Vibrio nitrifigilis]MBF9003128.1 TetR/AcrR family transcriptional regulator [Vibrio nitrifigilis]